MKIRIMSDLHLDPTWFLPLDIPHTRDEHETVLVIAGDAAEQKKAVPFILEMMDRFRHVILVPGNHEYYGGNTKRTPEKIMECIEANVGANPDNFSLLDRSEIVIDDVVFIGATLWTDFDGHSPLLMELASERMNDYRKIRTGPPNKPWQRKLRPDDVYLMHCKDRDYITHRVREWERTEKKVVVISHHAPTHKSIDHRFVGNALNGCYYSDQSNLILDRDIDLWIHGHVHQRHDYTLPDDLTRIVCNPRGYVSAKKQEQTEFDPLFTIEL